MGRFRRGKRPSVENSTYHLMSHVPVPSPADSSSWSNQFVPAMVLVSQVHCLLCGDSFAVVADVAASSEPALVEDAWAWAAVDPVSAVAVVAAFCESHASNP